MTTARTDLTNSTFYMLRCVVALVHADNAVKSEERHFIETMTAYVERQFIITPAQKLQLMQDLAVPQMIDSLLPQVTDKRDLENLILFTGMLAMADGEMHPEEEAVLRKIRAHCTALQPSTAASATAVATVAAGHMAPSIAIDMEALTSEVREIVQQEFYRQGIQKSGLVKKSSPLSVADAFVERGSLVHGGAYETLTKKAKVSVSTSRTLMHEERVLVRARFHIAYTIEAFLMAAVAYWLVDLAMPYVHRGLLYVQPTFNLPLEFVVSPRWKTVFLYDGFVAAMLVFIGRMLPRWATEIILTDRRLLYKQGVFFVKYVKIDLRQLFESVVNQSRLGAILNYGSVFIYSNMVDTNMRGDKDDRNIVLPQIADPHVFASSIDRAKRKLRVVGD